MSKTHQLQHEMLQNVNQIDITPLFREIQSKSLCGKLLNLAEYDDSDKFTLNIQNGESCTVAVGHESRKILLKEEIFVPSQTIASYPVFKIKDFRKKDFDLDSVISNAIWSITDSIDIMLLKMMLCFSQDVNITSKDDTNTIIVHPSNPICNLIPEAKILISSFKAYTIPTFGIVPMCLNLKEDMKEDVMIERVFETKLGDKRLLISNSVPVNSTFYCDNNIGTLCSVDKIYAMPVYEFRKLNIGVVIGGDFGLCIHDNPKIACTFT